VCHEVAQGPRRDVFAAHEISSREGVLSPPRIHCRGSPTYDVESPPGLSFASFIHWGHATPKTRPKRVSLLSPPVVFSSSETVSFYSPFLARCPSIPIPFEHRSQYGDLSQFLIYSPEPTRFSDLRCPRVAVRVDPIYCSRITLAATVSTKRAFPFVPDDLSDFLVVPMRSKAYFSFSPIPPMGVWPSTTP